MAALKSSGYRPRDYYQGNEVLREVIDLLALPCGTRLRLGSEAEVELTGLRNPCRQLDGLRDGLMAAVLDRDDSGALVRKSGVMAVVTAAGEVRAGDGVEILLPEGPGEPLQPV